MHACGLMQCEYPPVASNTALTLGQTLGDGGEKQTTEFKAGKTLCGTQRDTEPSDTGMDSICSDHRAGAQRLTCFI